jgi:hypothetical protein
MAKRYASSGRKRSSKRKIRFPQNREAAVASRSRFTLLFFFLFCWNPFDDGRFHFFENSVPADYTFYLAATHFQFLGRNV